MIARMNKKLNDLNETMAAPSSVDGNASLRGGPYGRGHKRQLATMINPATQAIENQEQAELNRNIQNQDWVNNHGRGADNQSKQGSIQEVGEPSEFWGRSGDSAGNLRMGAIEAPEIHVPQERPEDVDDYYGPYVSELFEFTMGASNAGGVNRSLVLPEPDDDVKPIEPAASTPGTGMAMLVAPTDHVPEELPQQAKMSDEENFMYEDIVTEVMTLLMERKKND